MRIYVSAKPRSKENRVEKISEGRFKVFVTEPPVEGRANAAIEEVLADYFNVPKSRVQIVYGKFRREKVVEVERING